MATTIAASFSKLRQNLEITSLQASTVSTRQENVREAVARSMNVLNSFLSGFYKRSTMIAPLESSDIDVFVILRSEYFSKYAPAGLLDKVRNVLLETYPKTPKISRNGQAVTITFTDFTVDVVPGFHRQGGGYLIPNSISDQWLSTDPTVHDARLSGSNQVHNGDLVPLVKMIKGWNRVISDGFVGFYLELMTQEILNNVTISNFSSGVRFVFDKGREKIRYKIADPAGYGGDVNGLCSVPTVDNAVKRFTTAYERAAKAEAFEATGHIEAATLEWKKIFGDYFPAYG
ncbi:MAG: hypothetical protein KF876_06240 [Nitrospira sp.]|nr:hypothetical protein [Nitrospira sp.]